MALQIGSSADASPSPTPAEGTTGRFFHTAWEELPPVPEPVSLVDRLLLAGALTVLYAPSGLGKTEVALQLANAVANQTDFYGRTAGKSNVLYVDYEMGEQNFRRYGNRLGLRGMIRAEHDVPLLDLKPLIQAAIADGCQLVILDSYASLSNQTGHENAVNSNGVAELVLKPLADLAHQSGTAIVVLHHTNKGNVQYDGSQRIKALSDMMLKLTLNRRTRMLELNSDKSRYGVEPLSWDASGHPLLHGTQSEDASEHEDQRREWLLEQLRNGPCTVDDLEGEYQKVTGRSRKSLERDLSDTVNDGLVTRARVGRSNQFTLAATSMLA